MKHMRHKTSTLSCVQVCFYQYSSITSEIKLNSIKAANITLQYSWCNCFKAEKFKLVKSVISIYGGRNNLAHTFMTTIITNNKSLLRSGKSLTVIFSFGCNLSVWKSIIYRERKPNWWNLFIMDTMHANESKWESSRLIKSRFHICRGIFSEPRRHQTGQH